MVCICILGAAGYIGSKLTLHLASCAELQIIAVDQKPFPAHCELPSNVEFIQARSERLSPHIIKKCDFVIFLAGLSGRASCAASSWGNIYAENIQNPFDIASVMNDSQVFIYASSASVLEGGSDRPEDESYELNEGLMDTYALSMSQREKKLQNTMTNTIGLRFGTVIGLSPHQRFDLIHIAMTKSAYINDVIYIQHPSCSRSVLSMNDLLRAFDSIIFHFRQVHTVTPTHSIYNLSSFNTTVAQTASAIQTKIPSAAIVDNTPENTPKTVMGFAQNTDLFKNTFNFEFKGTPQSIIDELFENIVYLITQSKFISEDTCRVCASRNMMEVIDIGPQPLANNYVDTPCEQEKFPLILNRCRDCNHCQLGYTVPPSKMFSHYQYNSSTSRTLLNYFQFLADKCIVDSGKKTGVVLELACNDGSQLNYFKERGWTTYGVDPAENIGKMARSQGHTIYTAFWGTQEVKNLPEHIDIIVAQNVLAHVPDPVKFLSACRNAMSYDTKLYIQTSQCNMMVNGEFDTVYHEHLSYFTVYSLMTLVDKVGLIITELTRPDIHGVSFLARMEKRRTAEDQHDQTVIDILLEQHKAGVYTDKFYVDYMRNIASIKSNMIDAVSSYVQDGYKVIAYGAAAKGMTIMNYFDLSCIEYIIDDAVMKHYKYTPGCNVMIVPPTILESETSNLCIVVFAWNFIDEIVSKIKKHKAHGTTHVVIQPFPALNFFTV